MKQDEKVGLAVIRLQHAARSAGENEQLIASDIMRVTSALTMAEAEQHDERRRWLDEVKRIVDERNELQETIGRLSTEYELGLTKMFQAAQRGWIIAVKPEAVGEGGNYYDGRQFVRSKKEALRFAREKDAVRFFNSREAPFVPGVCVRAMPGRGQK